MSSIGYIPEDKGEFFWHCA